MSGSPLGLVDPDTQTTASPAPTAQTFIPLLNQTRPLAVAREFGVEPEHSPIPVIAFPNYMQVRRVLPIWFWHVMRFFSVILAITVGILLFIQPALGLNIFWGLFIPVLPLVFFAAPGLWRNLCPMAALNQTPRLFKFSRNLTLPPRFKEYAYISGIGMFFLLVFSRKIILNQTGWALGIVVLGALSAAFVMGSLFKGKSGWCSSICPLLPVQRLYGQTPYLKIPNSHCQPCVGCTTNCYDFNPQVAYLSDLSDKNLQYIGYRKFFAGVFPGMILAFYTVLPNSGFVEMALQFLLYMTVSLGSFYVANSLLKVSSHKITTLYAGAALNIYYWFNFPLFARFLGTTFHFRIADNYFWTARIILYMVTCYWVVRTYRKEKLFVEKAAVAASPGSTSVSSATGGKPQINRVGKSGSPAVTFLPDNLTVAAEENATLLEIAECGEVHIEAGCRMGMCGADPVGIVAGMDQLSPLGDDEKATLDRLGLAENTRLACCARVRGEVTVSLKPDKAGVTSSGGAGAIVTPFNFDPAVRRIVIVGNGVAGVTTADHIRRRHPECEIHLVAREEHQLYNRMGITRLIYGRSAMQGLYLMPESWYDERNITCWLNTQAQFVDAEARTVMLGTGEILEYDRLILATGSRGAVPESIKGFGLAGSFVLREAADAMQIRAFSQTHGSLKAVIAGGGLLGLEAAYALHKLGLEVTVLERSKGLLRRQLDLESGQFLLAHLNRLGIRVLYESEVEAIEGDESSLTNFYPATTLTDQDAPTRTGPALRPKVKSLRLKSGRNLPCDIVVLAAGIEPNVEMARSIGLAIRRGVVVDDFMRTSRPEILAVGDVAEHRGQLPGLWATAVAQAETAAINAIGGSELFRPPVPVTMLKVVGVDLTSIGQFEATSPAEQAIVFKDETAYRYRKLVISNGKIVGAILLGYPQDAPGVIAAVKKELEVSSLLPDLWRGNWQSLNGRASG